MKIGLFNYSDNLGGAARATFRIHKSLLNEGYNSTLYVNKKNTKDNSIKTSPYMIDKNFYNIRTSIVGREFLTKKSLIEWFLKQNDVVLKGFINHNWNGITTQAFGEFLYTLIVNNLKIPNTVHIIPKNVVNKYQLLKIFKDKFETRVSIQKFKAPIKIDRTLSTIYKRKIDKIWKLTSFKYNPTIRKMLDLI